MVILFLHFVAQCDEDINFPVLLAMLSFMFLFLCIHFSKWEIRFKDLPAHWIISLAKKAHLAGKSKTISAEDGLACQFVESSRDPSKDENYTFRWRFLQPGEETVQMYFSFLSEQGKKKLYVSILNSDLNFFGHERKIQKMSAELAAYFLPEN